MVQVWGCAGASTREAQVKQKQWEHKETERHKNRKVCITYKNTNIGIKL